MIQYIIDAISRTIYDRFGEKTKIYTDTVEQGLIKPCFFINIIDHTLRPDGIDRYLFECSLNVDYITNKEQKSIDLNTVSFELYRLLGVLEMGDNRYLGRNLKSTVDDDILHFFVNYKMNLYIKDGSPMMKELKQYFI